MEEKELFFGYRGKIIQSYCKKCRGPHKKIEYTESINPIFNTILHGKQFDFQKTVEYSLEIPKFDENGKYISHRMKKKLCDQYLKKKFQKPIDDFLELLNKHGIMIESEKFKELFCMYNFDVIDYNDNDFFDFKISLKNNKNHAKNQNNIFVIIKLYQKISETYMKVLSTKLQDSYAIIISLSNVNPLEFSYDHFQVCLLDLELLRSLLLYRMDKIPLNSIHELFSKSNKL
ncbi:MAG: hypothetical protein J4F36_07185 [Nitrosopumilaceae archaeon]|nr:hypothetical protein [Nitrosopumilaceae archaeon]